MTNKACWQSSILGGFMSLFHAWAAAAKLSFLFVKKFHKTSALAGIRTLLRSEGTCGNFHSTNALFVN